MKNNLNFIILGMLLSSQVQAQTQKYSIDAQIQETIDLVSSVMEQMKSSGSSMDQDPDLKPAFDPWAIEVQTRLEQFEKGLKSLVFYPIGVEIDRYRATVSATNFDAGMKKNLLDSQMQLIQGDLKNFTEIYQKLLSSLLEIRPEWLIQSMELIKVKHHHRNLKLTFHDQSTEESFFDDGTERPQTNWGWLAKSDRDFKKSEYAVTVDRYMYWAFAERENHGSSWNQPQMLSKIPHFDSRNPDDNRLLSGMYSKRILSTLLKVCKSQFCVTNMIVKYENYFNSILSKLNRTLSIPVNETGQVSIQLPGLRPRESGMESFSYPGLEFYPFMIVSLLRVSELKEFKALPGKSHLGGQL